MPLNNNEKIQTECSRHTSEYITEAPAASSFTFESAEINIDKIISKLERIILRERNKKGCRS